MVIRSKISRYIFGAISFDDFVEKIYIFFGGYLFLLVIKSNNYLNPGGYLWVVSVGISNNKVIVLKISTVRCFEKSILIKLRDYLL